MIMKTIQVRKLDGSNASFNFEHVISVEPRRLEGLYHADQCVITFITGKTWQVVESYSDLMERITERVGYFGEGK